MKKKKPETSKKHKMRIFRHKWREALKPVTDSNTFIVCIAGIGGLTEAALSFGTSWGIITGATLSGGLIAGGMQQDEKRQKTQLNWINKAGQQITSTQVDKDIIEDMEVVLKRRYFFSRDAEDDAEFKSMFNEASKYCKEADLKIDGEALSEEKPYIFIRDHQKPVKQYHLVDDAGHPIKVQKPDTNKTAQKLKR